MGTQRNLAPADCLNFSTPPAKVSCAVVPDVTEIVAIPGPQLIWVTIVTTTTHTTETVSITYVSLD